MSGSSVIQDFDSFSDINNKLDQEIRFRKKVTTKKKIDPGIATKVAVNEDGTITQIFPLTADDIPLLPISKVDGLSETIETLKDSVITKTIVNEVPAVTEFKIQNLSVDDLPDIPMEKIKGLTEVLILIETSPCRAPDAPEAVNLPPIEIIKYKDITIDVLPRELINQVNAISTTLTSLATKDSVEGLRKDVMGKLDANQPIEDGTFGIVRVDRKGLVVSGREIGMGDLPTSLSDDIYEIKRTMFSKADHNEVVELMNQLNSFINSMVQLDLGNIKNSIAEKCTKEEMHRVEAIVEGLVKKVAVPPTPAPDQSLLDEIQQLRSQITSLEGLVINLQQKVASLTLQVAANKD